MSDFNTAIIEEFRANQGRVGGPFEGAPMILVHHRGRRSGEPHVSPMMFLPDGNDANTRYVFASNNGGPKNPGWYHNLLSAGRTEVEVGAESFGVDVEEVAGAERDEVFGKQAERYPGFADYEKKTEGIRRIPVLKLTRR